MTANPDSGNSNLEYFVKPLAVSAGLLVAWFLGALVFTYHFYNGNQFLAVGDPLVILESLPSAHSIVAMGRHSLSIYSTEPGFVAELYDAGALAVLPTSQGTCLSLSSVN